MHGGLSNKINVPEMINSLMIAVALLALSGDGFYNKSSLSNILTAVEAGLHAPMFENIDVEIPTVAPTTPLALELMARRL